MITRTEIFGYAEKNYATKPDYPWAKTPNYAILRHKGTCKWYGAIIDIPAGKLGLPAGDVFDAVNLKCGPIMAGTLRGQEGIYPAWHMNKDNWITVVLNSSVEKELVFNLIDISYELTK